MVQSYSKATWRQPSSEGVVMLFLGSEERGLMEQEMGSVMEMSLSWDSHARATGALPAL